MKTLPFQISHPRIQQVSISTEHLHLPEVVLGEDFSKPENCMYPHGVHVLVEKTGNELTNK